MSSRAGLSAWLRRSAPVILSLALLGWLSSFTPPSEPGLSPAPDIAWGLSLWPGAGLAVGVLLRWRSPMLPAVALGWWACYLLAGLSPAWALGLAAGSSAGPWLATGLLQRHGFNPGLARGRDLVMLLTIGALGSAALSGANGAAWLAASGQLSWLDLPLSALRWWLLDALGVMVFALPLVLVGREQAARTQAAGARAKLLAAATLCSGALALLLPAPVALTLLWWLLPLLLCALCLQHGLVWSSAVTAGLVGLLLTGTGAGLGPFTPVQSAASWPDLGLPGLWLYSALLSSLLLLCHALGGAFARQALRSEQALAGAGIGMAHWQPALSLVSLSPTWCALSGDDQSQRSQGWAGWLEQVHDEDRAALSQALADGARRPGPWQHRMALRLLTDEGWRWRELRLAVQQFDHQGQALELLASLSDISALRQAQDQQQLSARVLQQLHEGLLVTDAELRVIDLNPAYSRITGFDRDMLLGKVPALLKPDDDDVTGRARQASLWAGLHNHGHWAGELHSRRHDGHPLQLVVTVTGAPTSDTGQRHYIVLINDVTEQQRQREQLLRQAHFDELTRLPNRARLGELMAQAMAATDRDGYLLVVCFLDLDHFKAVNSRHGHQAGDELLAEFANRLRTALRSRGPAWSDSAARLGGDEFVLLLRAGTLDEARAAVERVLRVLAAPLQLAPDTPAELVTASVGATVYPLDASNADTLLRHADQAMYSVKQSGRNGYMFFDPEQSRRTEQRVLALGRLQDALDQGELQLYYQPKVDLQRGMVLGVEALLRWIHPERGVLPPAQFLPLIERTGLSARVGDHVLAQALDQLEVWQRQGLDLSVSVNISNRHLQEADFALRLGELLARHQPPLGQRLELEVLETVALTDIAYTSALMSRCAELGVRWALDDFGTGYSTLTYLKRLPVQVLKIDRSFVQNMLADSQDRAIVEGVIGLASTFGCLAVAEGVENPAQARMLLDMGCHIGQGLGIAAPMPAAEVGPWIREWRGLFVPDPASSAADHRP